MALLLGKDECDVVNIIVYISILREQNFLLVSIYILLLLHESKINIELAYIVAVTKLVNRVIILLETRKPSILQ